MPSNKSSCEVSSRLQATRVFHMNFRNRLDQVVYLGRTLASYQRRKFSYQIRIRGFSRIPYLPLLNVNIWSTSLMRTRKSFNYLRFQCPFSIFLQLFVPQHHLHVGDTLICCLATEFPCPLANFISHQYQLRLDMCFCKHTRLSVSCSCFC